MSYRGILERYTNRGGIVARPRTRVKLPRVWPGLAVAILGSVWGLLDLWNGLGKWNDPFPIGSFLVLFYWYFCIFRLHQVVKYLEPSYRIGPFTTTAFTVLPNIVIAGLGALIPENTESLPPLMMLVLVLCFLGALGAAAFAIFWQIFWTWCLTSYLKRNQITKLPNWLTGVALAIAYIISIFSPPLGLLGTFGLALFMVQKLQLIYQSKEAAVSDLESLEETALTLKKNCTECNSESANNAKFCNSCGARFFGDDSIPVTAQSFNDLSGVLLNTISRNAYRTLGTNSCATQFEIVKASASLRRSAKLGAKKQLPGDLHALGQVPREFQEIQDALDRLANPERRVEERLFWFHRLLSDSQQKTGDDTDSGGMEIAGDDETAMHDRALLSVITISIKDPSFTDSAGWQKSLKLWMDLCSSDDYWQFARDTELSGQFEPAANDDEFKRLRQLAPRFVLQALTKAGRIALLQNRSDVTQRALGLLRSVAMPADSDWDFEFEICGDLEKQLESLCDSIDDDCGKRIQRGDENSKDDVANNKTVCLELLARYERDVKPKLSQIVSVAGEGSTLARRSKETSVLCLQRLAGAFTWAEDFERAERLLQACSDQAKNTIVEARIDEALSSIKEQSRQAAMFKDLKPVNGAPALGNFFGFGFNIFSNPLRTRGEDPVMDSYMATYAFTALWFIPLIPISRYRVVSVGDRILFLAKGPMRTFDRIHQLVGTTLGAC